MTRRTHLFALILLTACGSQPDPGIFNVPEQLGDAWVLSSTEELPSRAANIVQMGLRYGVRAQYTGPADLSVTFYQMKTDASAFELMQTWRPEPGKLAIYRHSWFAVLESSELETAALSRIASEIEASLPGK